MESLYAFLQQLARSKIIFLMLLWLIKWGPNLSWLISFIPIIWLACPISLLVSSSFFCCFFGILLVYFGYLLSVWCLVFSCSLSFSSPSLIFLLDDLLLIDTIWFLCCFQVQILVSIPGPCCLHGHRHSQPDVPAFSADGQIYAAESMADAGREVLPPASKQSVGTMDPKAPGWIKRVRIWEEAPV